MRKGFTLVELAVVLVIIGIIAGMALKAKSLLEVARMTKEVNNFRLVNVAVTAYFASYPRIKTTKTGYDLSLFEKFGAAERNFRSPYIVPTRGYSNARYAVYNCKLGLTGNAYVIELDGNPNSALCVSMVMFSGVNPATPDVSDKYLCMIEKLLDDSNFIAGELRLGSGYASGKTGDYFDDCYVHEGNFDGDNQGSIDFNIL